MNTFQRQDIGQGALRTKLCVKMCFSYLTLNLKIAGREHPPGRSSPFSGICVFPDLCPTPSHMPGVRVVPTVTPRPQLQEGHLESVSARTVSVCACEGASGIIIHHPYVFSSCSLK